MSALPPASTVFFIFSKTRACSLPAHCTAPYRSETRPSRRDRRYLRPWTGIAGRRRRGRRWPRGPLRKTRVQTPACSGQRWWSAHLGKRSGGLGWAGLLIAVVHFVLGKSFITYNSHHFLFIFRAHARKRVGKCKNIQADGGAHT